MSNLPTLSLTVTPSSSPAPVAKPGPDWPVAKLAWGPAWELHWIGLGIGFALIAVHSLVALVMADKSKAFTRRLLFYAVNTLLLILGITRALYLWIDPYESGEHGFRCYLWMNKAIFGIAFPCLTSAFCLLHVAFLELSKMDVGSKKLHSLPFVASIIGVHFCIVLVSDTTVAIKANLKQLLIVCQSFFIIWGFLNSFAFLYSGGKFIYNVRKTRRELAEMSTSRTGNRTCNLSKIAKITLVTTFFGFLICIVQIYSMVGVYGMYSNVVNPAPWPWYAFQTGFRLVELVMGWTLAYTVVQPRESNRPSLVWRLLRIPRNTVKVLRTSSTNVTVRSSTNIPT